MATKRTAKERRAAKLLARGPRKPRRVIFDGLHSDQIAELNPDGQIEITTFTGYIKGFKERYLMKPPFASERFEVEAGSEDERINVDYLMRMGEPRFQDSKSGTCFY